VTGGGAAARAPRHPGHGSNGDLRAGGRRAHGERDAGAKHGGDRGFTIEVWDVNLLTKMHEKAAGSGQCSQSHMLEGSPDAAC